MKARVKETGVIVDVVFETSYIKDGVKIILWTDGSKNYLQDKLDFKFSDMPSEKRMRYELTKASMPSCLESKFRTSYKISEIVKVSLDIVDEVIKQLKERKDE